MTVRTAAEPDYGGSLAVDVADLRVAIAHDYLTQRGGAERVVVALLEVFPNARLVTSVYQAEATFPEFRSRAVETTSLDRLPAFRRNPRLALPLLPRAFSNYPLHDVDVVLCSSSGFAHGIHTTGPKIVYCHNPPRWLYQPEDHLPSRLAHLAMGVAAPPLRAWDQRAANSVTTYIVNSTAVQSRVRQTYGRQSIVLPPPVAIDPTAARKPVAGLSPGFLLTVSRSRGYKNTAQLARAMSSLPQERLVVVGDAEPSAGTAPNVTRLGRVEDAELRWLYANAGALVALSREDFGLTPVEAYSFGTPALVLRAGGYLDTTVPGLTGLFIEGETVEDVVSAVRRFRSTPPLDRGAIVKHSRRWTKERFAADLKAVIAQSVASHRVAGGTGFGAVAGPRRLRVVHAERRRRLTGVDVERRGARHESS